MFHHLPHLSLDYKSMSPLLYHFHAAQLFNNSNSNYAHNCVNQLDEGELMLKLCSLFLNIQPVLLNSHLNAETFFGPDENLSKFKVTLIAEV